MAHGRKDVLEVAAEDARLRKLADHEMRRPPAWFFEEGWDARPFRPVKECAERGNVDRSTVVRWQAWVRNRDAQQARRDEWRPEGDYPEHWLDFTVEDVPRLVEDVAAFRAKYFVARNRKPYMTPVFQRRWLEAILTALLTGGRLNILSPPRHGKSDLMIHFCLWLIVHWPHVLILWVGGNEKIAARATGAMMRALTTNKLLIEDFAGPGQTFRPGSKDGLPWSRLDFIVATAPNPDKGSTVTAIGRGGTLLSLDADVVVEDDIEDHGSTVQPKSRDDTKDWQFTQVESRKEEHSAIINIGSRQHVDDLASHLLENTEWVSIVETAHDPACMILPSGDHIDCMLFPEVRSFRWLMQQKVSGKRRGSTEGNFNMVYLNLPSDLGLQVFPAEIVDPCLSPKLHLGVAPKEPGRLVAGLDPSGASGYQAAVLLWFRVEPDLKIVVVDVQNEQGGGVPQFGRIMRAWYEKYKLSHWVVESNLHQGLMTQDRDIKDYASSRGIYLEDWKTHLNKLDQNIGVTSMQDWFLKRQILLPFGETSQEKIREFRDQLIYWDGNAPKNRNRTGLHTDLVMALWFCKTVIRRAEMEWNAEMGVDYDGGYRFSDWDQTPWGDWDQAPWQRAV